MRILRRFADNENPDSLASRLRRKRFELALPLFRFKGGTIKILDIGGTQSFWDKSILNSFPHLEITVANLFSIETTHSQIKSIVSDGRDLSMFSDKSFDVAFSNSVIEHLSSEEDQKIFANEAKRVGEFYFIQTPNYYFPLEPHFLFPGFQFLPFSARVWLIQNFNLGWVNKASNRDEAKNIVRHVRLLSASNLQLLFPEAKILKEKFCGLTKSLIATNF